MEDRIRALEGLATQTGAKLVAVELAVRALIATHPGASAALATFDRLSAEVLHKASDLSFEGGLPVSHASTQNALLQSELAQLRRCFGAPDDGRAGMGP